MSQGVLAARLHTPIKLELEIGNVWHCLLWSESRPSSFYLQWHIDSGFEQRTRELSTTFNAMLDSQPPKLRVVGED